MSDPHENPSPSGQAGEAVPARSKRGRPWALVPALVGAFALGVVVMLASQRLFTPRAASPPRAVVPREHSATTLPPGAADSAQASAVAVETAAVPSAATGMHPLIDASFGYLIGGVNKGQWVEAEKIAPLLTGKEKYRLYALDKSVGEATGSKPEESEITDFAITLTPDPEAGSALIGVCGAWNALPRTPILHNPAQKVYQDLVAAMLREKGLPDAPVRVTQAIGIDLDNDGERETLVSATTPRPDYPGFSVQKNDYSLVLLRKRTGKETKTFTLYGDFATKDASDTLPLVHRVTAVLDVNGDGSMEIIVGSDYYEGYAQSIFALRDGEPQRVMINGAGL